MRRNEDRVNGAVPFNRARRGRVARAAAAVAVTLLVFVLHSPVALADGGGFDGSGGGDVDEQESGWWDGLPNIVEDFFEWFFPSATYGGGGGGHAFGNEEDGWWTVGGGDGGGSSSSSSSSVATDGPAPLMRLSLVGSVDSSSYKHQSYPNYTTTDTGYSTTGSATYDSSWANVSQYPKVNNMRLDVSGVSYNALNQWRTSGYDVLAMYLMRSGSSGSLYLYIVESGKWHFVETDNRYRVDAGGKYSTLKSGSQVTIYDGTDVVAWSDANAYNLTPQATSNGSPLASSIDTSASTAWYVGVLYADGSSGSGGAPTGGGGDNPSGGGDGGIHFGGDTYNYDTTNYNDYTVINDSNVDLSPVTKRQDVLISNTSQLGRDLEMLAVVVDRDLMTLYATLLYQAKQLKVANGYLASMESDLELVVQALNNLQDQSGLGTVRGYLKMIYDELAAWPEYPQPTQVNVPDPVATDLSGVESKLDEVIRLLRSGAHTNPTIPHDDDNDIGVEIGDKMQQVAQRFPFSVPWDVMHILGLLRSERVAPQFDLPVIGSDESVHVDLSGWETVAVVTRSGTFVLFALGLALRSKTLITSWSGGNA